jgi:hypothetical protein
VKVLVQHGADISAVNGEGDRYFDCAAKGDHYTCVEVLEYLGGIEDAPMSESDRRKTQEKKTAWQGDNKRGYLVLSRDKRGQCRIELPTVAIDI